MSSGLSEPPLGFGLVSGFVVTGGGDFDLVRGGARTRLGRLRRGRRRHARGARRFHERYALGRRGHGELLGRRNRMLLLGAGAARREPDAPDHEAEHGESRCDDHDSAGALVRRDLGCQRVRADRRARARGDRRSRGSCIDRPRRCGADRSAPGQIHARVRDLEIRSERFGQCDDRVRRGAKAALGLTCAAVRKPGVESRPEGRSRAGSASGSARRQSAPRGGAESAPSTARSR